MDVENLKLYTIRGAAEMCGISYSKMHYAVCWQKAVGFFLVRSSWRILATDLEDYLQRGPVPAGTPLPTFSFDELAYKNLEEEENQSMEIEPNRVYTVKEVADMLRVSTATILNELKDGNIGFQKARGQYRIPARDLEVYFKKNYYRPKQQRPF